MCYVYQQQFRVAIVPCMFKNSNWKISNIIYKLISYFTS